MNDETKDRFSFKKIDGEWNIIDTFLPKRCKCGLIENISRVGADMLNNGDMNQGELIWVPFTTEQKDAK